jgi:hypothetical protein
MTSRPSAGQPSRGGFERPTASHRGATPPTRTVPGRTFQRPSVRDTPRHNLRPSSGPVRPGGAQRPLLHRSTDARYHRPSYRHVRAYPAATYVVPGYWGYRPYYSRWWCHPYYRYSYATVAVVGFGFTVYAWDAGWVPPYRAGWVWVPGYWSWGYWHPGFWRPVVRAPVGYVYVNGWWEGDAYVEGYYRAESRDDWEWVDGYYLDDGTYVRGHWVPTYDGPDGYRWEPGFWDGETYVEGFWRPQFRRGFFWVSSYYDESGIFHSGYWMPEEERPGQIWIPGWFDGNEWVQGYWEDEQAYYDADLDDWQPEEGLDDGWEVGEVIYDGYDDVGGDAPPSARIVELYEEVDGEAPLAVPVVIPDDIDDD